MLWANPRDVVLYTRFVYYIPFSDIILILLPVLVFNPEKLWERLPLHYVSCGHVIMFSVSGSLLENLLYVTLPQKQETGVSLVLKDGDTDSENLSSLIWLSVSDSQKTDNSADVSFIGI